MSGDVTIFREMSATGWRPPSELSFEEWQERGEFFQFVEGAVQWCLGDWLNYGEKRYGETYTQAIEATGASYTALTDYKWVSKRYESSTRVENLSWAHHREVASLPPDDRADLLQRAADERWSVKALKAEKSNASRAKRIGEIHDNALETGKQYPIVYADPPWRYENPPIGSVSRAIENHYPTMSLDEICALPVSDLATDNALLYLWATAPKLAECMKVIEAWGFEYRTNMVWDKVKIGMGYHARNQHEILLIAKRGEIPPPQAGKQPASLIRVPRAAHSAKPSEFYEIIEAAYPDLPKIELFCRSPREGWAAWGNQIESAA